MHREEVDQGRWARTLATFLKPTVRMSRAVKAREAELRISHAGAAIAPTAVATPARHTCTWDLLASSRL